MIRILRTVLPCLVLGVSACATSQAPSTDDPFEAFNRRMFAVNDGLDRAILEPVAMGYRAATNEPIRRSVSDFTNNLGEPVTFVNQLLQLKLDNAADTAGRFAINSTIGLVGLFDPASGFGIARTKEDFGQTLAGWGMASGPYLVLPILGSTSPRDLLGLGVDIEMNPLNLAHFDGDRAARLGVIVLRSVARRELAIDLIDGARRTQVDPYTTMKTFHLRSRATAIQGNQPTAQPADILSDDEMDF